MGGARVCHCGTQKFRAAHADQTKTTVKAAEVGAPGEKAGPGFRRCSIRAMLAAALRHTVKFPGNWAISMCQKFAAIALVLAALAIAPLTAQAEMGPCTPDDRGGLTCGNGEGAARVIPKTRSPSSRLALAWRLKSSAPGYQLHEGNPDLESLIVRIEDGAILAKSRGTY